MKEEGEYVEDELKRDETDASEYSDVRGMLFVDPVGSTETGEEDIRWQTSTSKFPSTESLPTAYTETLKPPDIDSKTAAAKKNQSRGIENEIW